MKGIVLAGGLATRLRPLTWVTNKHLLPVYYKPMIYYPLEAMAKAGIKEVLLTTSADHAGHFTNLLKTGEEFGINLLYAIQHNPKGGIADAMKLAEQFARGEKIIVILGDNIFGYNLKPFVDKLKKMGKGAIDVGVRMPMESKHYGVIEMDERGKVISIVEKPEIPKSDIIQTGIYLYDERVFDFIRTLKPSGREELEVTDLNNCYVKEGSLMCELIDWWIDAGASFDELLRANVLVAEKVRKGEL